MNWCLYSTCDVKAWGRKGVVRRCSKQITVTSIFEGEISRKGQRHNLAARLGIEQKACCSQATFQQPLLPKLLQGDQIQFMVSFAYQLTNPRHNGAKQQARSHEHLNCENLTLLNVKINGPETCLIRIGRSTGVNITGADIEAGDDCVSIGDGSQQIHIGKVFCWPGHGISIGNLGRNHDEQPVVGVTVKNCTITSTSNGIIRVKTWLASLGGFASNLRFEDIFMNNVDVPILPTTNAWQRFHPVLESKMSASKASKAHFPFQQHWGLFAAKAYHARMWLLGILT